MCKSGHYVTVKEGLSDCKDPECRACFYELKRLAFPEAKSKPLGSNLREKMYWVWGPRIKECSTIGDIDALAAQKRMHWMGRIRNNPLYEG